MNRQTKMPTCSIIFVLIMLNVRVGVSADIFPIPDTGQIQCYNNSRKISCPVMSGMDFYGQDANYDADGAALDAGQVRYTRIHAGADEMVQDHVTGLIWEVKTALNDGERYTWEEANAFIDALNADKFGGQSDWRLPTVKELAFIVNRNRYAPAIGEEFLPDDAPAYGHAKGEDLYWSSTTESDDPATATDESANLFYVDFYGGHLDSFTRLEPEDKDIDILMGFYKRHVRAVRGKSSRSVFVDNRDGTVTDAMTGLMWQQIQSGDPEAEEVMRWKDALNHCRKLNDPDQEPTIGGYDDWRLPNINELIALADPSRRNPATDPSVAGRSSPYWSSTTRVKDNYHAWAVNFNKGSVLYNSKGVENYVRLVRGGANEPIHEVGTGDDVTDDLWIKAVINTDEKGRVAAVWHKGGQDETAREDEVIWGHFHASPDDVTWGSENNPDLFVKIWFDADGRVDVNFFHVSVPEIEVYSKYKGASSEYGITTLDRRYIRHWYKDGLSGFEENEEDGLSVAGDSPDGDPSGYLTRDPGTGLIDELRIGAIIRTEEEKGPVDAIWRVGGQDTTARGDRVIWGHFHASPDDVAWGSTNNPDLFVKLWFDITGRVDVNFFHVSVPEIEVYSAFPSDAPYDEKGTTTMGNRYIRHERVRDEG